MKDKKNLKFLLKTTVLEEQTHVTPQIRLINLIELFSIYMINWCF